MGQYGDCVGTKIIRSFEQSGHKILIFTLINIYNIPCVRCEIYDMVNKIKLRGSTAVRSNFNLALYAALNEAYMGYTIYFVGTRDDFTPLLTNGRKMVFEEEKKWFFDNNHFIQPSVASDMFDSINEELEYVILKLINAGIEHLLVANISPKDSFRLKSVKVIIPKMDLIFIKPYKDSEGYREKVNKTRLLI